MYKTLCSFCFCFSTPFSIPYRFFKSQVYKMLDNLLIPSKLTYRDHGYQMFCFLVERDRDPNAQDAIALIRRS